MSDCGMGISLAHCRPAWLPLLLLMRYPASHNWHTHNRRERGKERKRAGMIDTDKALTSTNLFSLSALLFHLFFLLLNWKTFPVVALTCPRTMPCLVFSQTFLFKICSYLKFNCFSFQLFLSAVFLTVTSEGLHHQQSSMLSPCGNVLCVKVMILHQQRFACCADHRPVRWSCSAALTSRRHL